MATFLAVAVFIAFIALIFTGGYNSDFLDRARKTKIWDWLTTVDHKKIGILYISSGAFFFLFAGVEAILMRIQLLFPGFDFIGGATFNQLLTMHGTTMIFLVAMPVLIGFMNVIVPLQIGARDVAFPFLNALGFWLFFAGAMLFHCSILFGGMPDSGWTSYVPISLNDYSEGPGVDYYTVGLQIAGLGTIAGAVNFLVTIVNMRAPGMTLLRMPMFTWTTFVTSALLIFAIPPLTVALFLLMFDRLFGGNFFNVAAGGDVVIWEHLFWIFGHPEVYIVILPAFGMISEVISTFAKKRLFGYTSMVFATVLIGFLGFMVWAHHMFTVGLGPMANSIFAVATMTVAVPTGIKVFNWLFTMWGGRLKFTTAMIWAVAFIPTFVMGGVTGVMLGTAPADYQFHDTYFVVAHFHYVLIGGTVFGIFAAVYYWWPKMFGKLLDEKLGKWHFWPFFIGFHLTFFPQHFLGLFGMPRRVFTYESSPMVDMINFVSTIGVIGMTIGSLAFFYNIYVTTRYGKQAEADPWDGRTLEWSIPSPPPSYNFAQLPVVRGLDALWLEKMVGKKEMTPAEPLQPIHMPSSSHIPLIISLGFFMSGFGFVFRGFELGALGLVIAFFGMFMRSFDKDRGYYIPKEELENVEKGA